MKNLYSHLTGEKYFILFSFVLFCFILFYFFYSIIVFIFFSLAFHVRRQSFVRLTIVLDELGKNSVIMMKSDKNIKSCYIATNYVEIKVTLQSIYSSHIKFLTSAFALLFNFLLFAAFEISICFLSKNI